jgi:hypothetical protein
MNPPMQVRGAMKQYFKDLAELYRSQARYGETE